MFKNNYKTMYYIFWNYWFFFKALKFDSIAGIEKVLEGTLEIFRWMFLFEPIGVRYFVPILLLQVGRVDDAYNLTKFLMFNYANNSDEDLQVLVKKKDWLASLPKHDTTEGIFDEKLLGRYLWVMILWIFDIFIPKRSRVL